MDSEPIVLYDGTCVFCNESVLFILRHEKNKALQFAHLQSAVAQEKLKAHGIVEELDSIYVVLDDQILWYSDAVLEISKHLKRPYSWLGFSKIIPKSLRDMGYKFIAKHRKKILGSRDSCAYPSQLTGRILS